MTTDALVIPRPSTFLVNSGFGFDLSKIKTYKGSKGRVYEKVPVFRTGTFRDSMGYQNTWESLHLEQMIANSNHLQKKHIMDGWPVRDGHSTYLVGGVQGRGNTVGWTHDLAVEELESPVDGQKYSYLLSTYEITEPYAQEKIDNGTWRNRSSEIGRYTTNDESELWPCFMGFAFVDIPAVEGLNFESPNSGNRFFCVDLGGAKTNKETPVATDETGGLPLIPFSAPAAPAAQPQAPAVPAPAAPATGFRFNCNGVTVTDPTHVQTYINQLETAMVEQRQVARAAFVNSLVTVGKVLASQVDDYVKHAMSLNDAQYEFWRKQMGGSEPLALLSNHSVGASQPNGGQGSAGPVASDLPTQALKDAREIVMMHQRSGQTEEFIKQTGSYKALVAAGIPVQL